MSWVALGSSALGVGSVQELRIHDDTESGQYQLRIRFLDSDERSVVGNFFPYGTDKARSLSEAKQSAREASRRLNIRWIQ